MTRNYDYLHSFVAFEEWPQDIIIFCAEGDGPHRGWLEPTNQVSRKERLPHQIHPKPLRLRLHDDDILSRE